MTTFVNPTPFPLPHPTSAPVVLPIRAGNVEFTLRVAPELTGATRDLVDRLLQLAQVGMVENGRTTMVGFSVYWLVQTGPQQFSVQTFDYRQTDSFETARTDDLTTALWIEAAQSDVVRRSGVGEGPSEVTLNVKVQRAAMDVLRSGAADSLVLTRVTAPTAEQVAASEADDSGWVLSTTEEPKRRGRRTDDMVSGRLVSLAPSIIPFLALPAGTAAEFNGRTFRAAWQQTTPIRVFLDGSGAGAGMQQDPSAAGAPVADPPAAGAPVPAPEPEPDRGAPPGQSVPAAAPELVTVEHQVGELTLTTKAPADLEEQARSVVSHFARRDPAQLRDGFALGLGFNVFSLQQTGPSTYAVMAPNYLDPQQFHRERDDDLTIALRIADGQSAVLENAGLRPGKVTSMNDEITIQKAAWDAFGDGRPEPMALERIPLPEGQDFSADGRRRSGWLLTVARPATDDERTMRSIPAGALVAMLPDILGFLQLPDDSMLNFVGKQLQGGYLLDVAKIEALHQQFPNASMGELITERGAGRRIL